MPIDREIEDRLVELQLGLGTVDERLSYAERRVRALRQESFIAANSPPADLGEIGSVDTHIDFAEVAVPANPPANWRRVFANTATSKLSVRTSAGATVNLEYGDTEAIAAVEGEATLDLTGDVTIVGAGKSLEVINFKFETATELTISSGDVTATQVYHRIDTESDDASDNLDGIAGGADGKFLLLRAENDGRTVTVRHNQNAAAVNNILLSEGANAVLDDISDMLLLLYDATLDTNGAWVEVSRTVSPSAVHALLDGSIHTDTVAQGVTEGSLILANATPAWDELVISVPAANVRNVLGVDNGEATASWKAALDGTAPTTIAESAGAAAGTSLVFSHRDHTHGAPATWAATAHNLFSAVHGDMTGAANPVDGDVVIGNVTPKWSKLAISIPAANVLNVLGIANAEVRPSWKTALDATNPANIANAASAGTSLVFAHRDHVHAHPAGLTDSLHHVAFVQGDADALYDVLGGLAGHVAAGDEHVGYVLESLFEATTFLYAADDDIPLPKTPAEVMTILSAAATAAFDFGGQDLTNLGVLFLTEQAAAEGDVGDKGQIWVKSGAPNTLWFTDDAGTDVQLGLGAAQSVALLDGAEHTDTLAAGVTDGSVIIGNTTPKWSELVIAIPAANVRNVLGIDNAELRPSWKTALDATNPANIANAASAGTSLVFAHRDHVHAHPAGLTATLHHAKYTGGEAIAAVEGEATLALGGAVEVTGILTVDTINEKTGAAGVTVDGVTLRDFFVEVVSGAGMNSVGSIDLKIDSDNDSTTETLRVLKDAGVEIAVFNEDGSLDIDVINELSANAGVTIDGLLIKDEYLEFDEIAAPGAGAANKLRVYSRDVSGVTALCFVDAAGAEKTFLEQSVQISDRELSQVAVANTAVEASIYSYVIPAGILGTTGGARLTLAGSYFNSSGAARNLTLRIKLGATTVSGTVIAAIAASASWRRWRLELVCMNSAAAAQKWIGGFQMTHGSSVVLPIDVLATGTSHGGVGWFASAEDTSAARTLDVTIQHNFAHASLEVRKEIAVLEFIPTG